MPNIEKEGWEKIYRKEGELFPEPAPKVVRAAKVFKAKDFRDILDLGCGTGRNSIFLAKQGFSVYSTDISKTGVKITKTNAKKLGLRNICSKVHNMTTLPFSDASFDAIVCIFAMGHGTIADAQKTVDEMRRVLRPGGMVITEFMSVRDSTFGKGKKIEEGTFIDSIKGESGIAHHYFTKGEIKNLFLQFAKVVINPALYFNKIRAFDVEAIK